MRPMRRRSRPSRMPGNAACTPRRCDAGSSVAPRRCGAGAACPLPRWTCSRATGYPAPAGRCRRMKSRLTCSARAGCCRPGLRFTTMDCGPCWRATAFIPWDPASFETQVFQASVVRHPRTREIPAPSDPASGSLGLLNHSSVPQAEDIAELARERMQASRNVTVLLHAHALEIGTDATAEGPGPCASSRRRGGAAACARGRWCLPAARSTTRDFCCCHGRCLPGGWAILLTWSADTSWTITMPSSRRWRARRAAGCGVAWGITGST